MFSPGGGSELHRKPSPSRTADPGLESPPPPWTWSSTGGLVQPNLEAQQNQKHLTDLNKPWETCFSLKRGVWYLTQSCGDGSSSPSAPSGSAGSCQPPHAERRPERRSWRRGGLPGPRPDAQLSCRRCTQKRDNVRHTATTRVVTPLM